jgi:hypothetical protein
MSNPLPLLELLPWRHDLPPLGLPVILLRAEIASAGWEWMAVGVAA